MANTENKPAVPKKNAAYSKRRSGGYRRSYRRSRFTFSGRIITILVLCLIFFNVFGGVVFSSFRSSVVISPDSSRNNVDINFTYTDALGKVHYTYVDNPLGGSAFVNRFESMFSVISGPANFCRSLMNTFLMMTSGSSYYVFYSMDKTRPYAILCSLDRLQSKDGLIFDRYVISSLYMIYNPNYYPVVQSWDTYSHLIGTFRYYFDGSGNRINDIDLSLSFGFTSYDEAVDFYTNTALHYYD